MPPKKPGKSPPTPKKRTKSPTASKKTTKSSTPTKKDAKSTTDTVQQRKPANPDAKDKIYDTVILYFCDAQQRKDSGLDRFAIFSWSRVLREAIPPPPQNLMRDRKMPKEARKSAFTFPYTVKDKKQPIDMTAFIFCKCEKGNIKF